MLELAETESVGSIDHFRRLHETMGKVCKRSVFRTELLEEDKVNADKISGTKKKNGVFIGKSGQLLEDIAVPIKSSLKRISMR